MAAVPLARTAALGMRKGLPPSCKCLQEARLINTVNSTSNTEFSNTYIVHVV